MIEVEAASWPRNDAASGPAPIGARARLHISRHHRDDPDSDGATASALADPASAACRETAEILFALRVTPEGAVFEGIKAAYERNLAPIEAEVRGQGARAQTELRRTTEQLLSAQREERERIAIELHNSTGRRLAALGMGVSRLRRLMGSRVKAQDILDDMATSLDEAVKEIRVKSYLMKPPSLDRQGLEATAQRYVKEFGIRTGLSTVFRSEGPVNRASAMVQHAAFRVVQEALSNVHRHAGAKGIEVELASRDGELTLRIADDGKGIATLGRAHLEGIPPGVGIAGMRSRVEELDGSLEIASDRAGTVVAARVPLPDAPLKARSTAASRHVRPLRHLTQGKDARRP